MAHDPFLLYVVAYVIMVMGLLLRALKLSTVVCRAYGVGDFSLAMHTERRLNWIVIATLAFGLVGAVALTVMSRK